MTHSSNFLALLLGVNLLATPALAQSPTLSFQRLTLEQGLVSNYATSITQDDHGFIWIGTALGLVRFDGLRCVVYSRQNGNAHSLSSHIVRSVYKTRAGILWVGTQEGLHRFSPQKQAFQRYSFAALGPGCNLIRSATETPDGTLWFGTTGGVVAFNPATAKATRLPVPADSANTLAANAIRCVLADRFTLWIGSQGGLYGYDLRTKQFRTFRQQSAAASLPGDFISALTRHPHTGEIAVGTRAGQIALLNPATGRFRRLPMGAVGQEVSSLLFTKTGDLWAGVVGGGLQRYDSVKNQFLGYLNDDNNPRSLVSNSVKALFEDRSGVIWAVTNDGGVCWFNPGVEKFHSLFDDVAYRPASTLGLDVAALSIDRQNGLWVATHDGLLWIDPRTQAYRLYRHNPQDKHSLSNNYTYSVLADRRGQVWVGTPNSLDRLDPATGRFEHIPVLPPPQNLTQQLPFSPKRQNFVAGSQVFELAEAPDGRVFIGTNEKLTIYDPQTRTFAHQYNDERIRQLPGQAYNTLYFDRQNNLWAGGLGPVYKIGPDLRLLAQYERRDDDPSSLPDEGVTGFAEDALGRLWMATDDGLARLDQHTGRFTIFTTRHGLPGNDLAMVLFVGDTLWVSTSRGIARFDTRHQRPQITVFDEADGALSSEFESGALLRDNTGRLYFGAVRGLAYVQPGRIRSNRFVPPVYLTSFRVNDQEYLRGGLAQPPGVVLSHAQNGFTFEMAALSFDNPGGNRYAYRLEGFEKTWNQVGNRSFASYTNVPPGDYVLHVIAANNDGVWNRRGYRLPVDIRPPFWQTWWFRGLCLTALIGLVMGIIKLREKRLMKKQNELSEFRERIAASEMKALRSQMNPHFLYNSLNAIRLFVLQNDSDNADKYLVKFARLMRLILENSREEWVSLASELEQLKLYLELEQLRFDHQFDFSIEAQASLQKDRISIPPMIIQPYIENAILHGIAHKKTRGMIRITIQPQNGHLECVVDDDGVGRQKAAELKSKTTAGHRSVGLQVTEERLQLISQRSGKVARVCVIDKVDGGNQPAGTRVLIELPLVSH